MNFWQPLGINRRDFITTLAASAAAPLLAAEGKSFRFIAANDLHYDQGPCREWFMAMVEQMRQSAPDAAFCLLCGDIANSGQKAALAAVREIFAGLKIPIHAVPGNHDYDGAEEAGTNYYDEIFPGKLNYQFEHGGWQFIGLDSTMGAKFDKTTISNTTLAWLDAEIPKLDRAKPTVAFTHFPLGEKVAHTPLNAPAVVQRLLKLNLSGVLSGHWHGASQAPAGRAIMTTNRCCARVRGNADKSPLKGWFVCEAKPDGVLERKFVEFKAP